ncbi:CDP-glycerol glycerophosphotransferase family protein [Streptomyces polyrhachis]|uniref:CDP-glycerol glycerophosphotransferase family protein n=1 Tax=Streptomyces polyrhachis TaxID=1282885 RepID=A0ABW2GLW7_9ACTN
MASAARPRFSIVIPAHGVQAYIRECLESVLAQSFTDFEVIAVDDCSPDAGGAIIDEIAARDPRVIAVHHEENGGLGRARNTGVEHASGDYLLFLDGDDTYLPGSLRALAERLEETGEVDLLMFDHVRSYWTGEVHTSTTPRILAPVGDRVLRPVEEPAFFHHFAIVCNRAFRRDFYTGHGLTFTDGYYEDALMVYKVLLSARTAAYCGHRVLDYRQRRQGQQTQTPDRRQFSIFDQYQRLFDFLDERPQPAKIRTLLFERMVSHFLFALARRSRVPGPLRRPYLRRASAQYRRLRPAGYTPPASVLGLKFRAVGWGSYPLFQLLKYANGTRERLTGAARAAVRGVLPRLKRAAGRLVYRGYYALQRRRPLDPGLAVYGAYWGRTPACNPLAVYEAARRLAPHSRGVWVVRREHAASVPRGMDHVVQGSRRYWAAVARATYFVNNVNFPDALVKRPGQRHLMTHHGTPLKRMGLDQQRYPMTAKDIDFDALLARCDRWTHSLSANPHSTEYWSRVYPSDFTSLDTGYPRNDVYYRATAAEVREARAALGIAPGQRAVLYAPTTREHQDGYVPRLDFARVAAALGEDTVLLVRSHYSYDTATTPEPPAGVLDVSRHPSVEQLCLAADALVTDYSSIMFDYANLDRPIVIHADDWQTYAAVRGVTFDLLSGEPGDTPGPVTTTEDELVDAFTSGAWEDARSTRLRGAFRARFCRYDDGFAAERVVRRVLLDQRDAPAVVPLAQRTPAPSPRTAEGAGERTRRVPGPRRAESSSERPKTPPTHAGLG